MIFSHFVSSSQTCSLKAKIAGITKEIDGLQVQSNGFATREFFAVIHGSLISLLLCLFYYSKHVTFVH